MGPIDANYYFDPSMKVPPDQAKKSQPIRPDEEAAKLAAEKMKKQGVPSLMTGPDAARLNKKKEQEKKSAKNEKKEDKEKLEEDSKKEESH